MFLYQWQSTNYELHLLSQALSLFTVPGTKGGGRNQLHGFMRSEYILFVIYLVLSLWVIPKISFIRNTDLTSTQIRILYSLKLLSGLVFAFYFKNISTNTDYLTSNLEGEIQYNILRSHPTLFFDDFFNDVNTYGLKGLFQSTNSFWAYLRFNLLYKFLAVMDLVTYGNFYLNSIMFCSFVFFGHMTFYHIYCKMYKDQKLKIVFACFCLPSLLLYTSCVHKDGLVFLSLGFLSYILYKYLAHALYPRVRYIFFSVAGIATIFLFRNYVVVAIIPALFIAVLCRYYPYKKKYIVLITYLISSFLFFFSGLHSSSFNLPAAVVQRKEDFATLDIGTTNIPMQDLEPTFTSFAQNLPLAINHALFRPYLWEFNQPAVLLTALELLFYQLIIILFIVYHKKSDRQVHPFNLFGIALFFNMMLIIGYTIPNVGAIVRYRSIFWIFLICPLLCNIDWYRMLRAFQTLAPYPLN